MVVTITTIFRSIPQVQSAFFQSDLPSHAILTGVGERYSPCWFLNLQQPIENLEENA